MQFSVCTAACMGVLLGCSSRLGWQRAKSCVQLQCCVRACSMPLCCWLEDRNLHTPEWQLAPTSRQDLLMTHAPQAYV